MTANAAATAAAAAGRDAPAEHPIHDLMRTRWSPRSFADAPVTPAELRSMLEAARWAASCNNDQPWHFLVARREDAEAFARLLACLTPNNQGWAKKAGALLVGVARMRFAANGNPNAVALYDLGQAAAQLALQATAMGLQVHQMRGFDVEKVKRDFGLPADHEPAAAIAVGRVGDPAALPEALRTRETAPRMRRPISDFAFAGDWSTPLPW